MVLRSCEARFKDGTRLSVPADVTVDPVEIKAALAETGAVTAYLAVPVLHAGRANVEESPTAGGPRYWIDTVELDDENTGGGEQPVQVRRLRSRLLLSGQDQTGYEVLPLARVERSAQAEAPPRLDVWYVPPLAGHQRLARTLARRAIPLPPDRGQGRATGGPRRRPRDLVRQPGPGRRRAHPQAVGAETGAASDFSCRPSSPG